MRRLLGLLRPPEWSWWSVWDRIGYGVSFGCMMLLMSLGAGVVYRWVLSLF